MDPWLLEITFYVAGLVLIFLELFIPSGGVLGIAAVICLVYSLHSLFDRGYRGVGSAAIGLTVVYLFFVIRFWMKRMRLMTNLGSTVATGSDVERAKSLIGHIGVTISPLRPSGIARIEGERFDVVVSGSFIDANMEVTVVEVSGNRIVVRRSS